MKLARFAVDGTIHRGRVREDGRLVTSVGKDYSPEQVVWLPPVNPTKVIGLALNFAEHAAELDMESPPEPALFFKPVS
jgi:5-oxopent-3-ene-1,2,5-tricarboxylate decarboxylase/2-hydroxyhepta-2,4-diene-1,7-dioate isomerase